MGMSLVEHVQRFAPDDLTYKQLHVLVVLAGEAWDTTGVCSVDLTRDSELLMRLRMPRSHVYQAVEVLIQKGAVTIESASRSGAQVFRVSTCGVATGRHLKAVN